MKDGRLGKGKRNDWVRERWKIGRGKDGRLGERKRKDWVRERWKLG